MKLNSQIEVSKTTLEKAEAAKKYIENRYSQHIREAREREKQMKQVEALMKQLHLSKQQQRDVHDCIRQGSSEQFRKLRKRHSISDFDLYKIIGRGSFGEVRLGRDRSTGQVVAIKRLKKADMIERNQVNHVNLEKQILAHAHGHYVVELYCCFQDADFLYFVMEYLPGGDFMGLLIQRDILSQQEVRFYIMELIEAVEHVHSLGFIHRDIKPDNILIGADGHIKLTDFGLIRYTETSKFQTDQINKSVLTNLLEVRKESHQIRGKIYSRVGTPEYIAPEVFGKSGYDESIDWWSVGVILYESLFGFTPFSADSPKIVCQKVMNWKENISIPNDSHPSNTVVNLLTGLLCDAPRRLSIKKIKAHPFFKGADWKKTREMTPPFIPRITNPLDTKYFQAFQQQQPWISKRPSHKDFDFAVFNFNKSSKVTLNELADLKIRQLRKSRYSVNSLKNKKGLSNNRKLDTSYGEHRFRLPTQKQNKKPSRQKTKISRLRTVCN